LPHENRDPGEFGQEVVAMARRGLNLSKHVNHGFFRRTGFLPVGVRFLFSND
jgi:hypothetical protein